MFGCIFLEGGIAYEKSYKVELTLAVLSFFIFVVESFVMLVIDLFGSKC